MKIIHKQNPDRNRIYLDDLLKGRHLTYSKEYTAEVAANLGKLVTAVNGLLEGLEWEWNIGVSSGWRPVSINKKVGGAPKSAHIKGLAVDIFDFPPKLLTQKLLSPEGDKQLKKWGLWLEHPKFTSTWVHLDLISRGKRDKNIFIPY